MAENTFEWIKDTAQDFAPLFKRMDKDKDLYNLVEYKLSDIETKKEATDVVHMTMNDPKVFAERSMAFMSEVSMQIVAKGNKLTDEETTLIENFDKDIRYEIDQQLMVREIPGLYNFLIEQGCIRGTLAGRYITWEDKGQFRPDLLPCDSRYLVYEYGRKDLNRAAFKTIRSKATILDEYPHAIMQGTSTKWAIWEHWDKAMCEIWLSNPIQYDFSSSQKLNEYENKFGYVPFIIQKVGAGSMLQDEGAIAHGGESIFAPNRNLYDHLNMLASILQTLNYMTFNRVHQWESEAGTLAKHPPKPGQRKTIAIDKGTRGLFPVEISDIKNATRLFYALILGAIQRGALPNIDYGNLTFPLSAVAISRLSATKDAIFSPRLQAIAWFYRKLHYMIRDQYIKGGYDAELGEEGLERKYPAKDLDHKYSISYKFDAVSPEQDIANYAVAQQALAIGMSKLTVYTDIVKLPDPTAEIMRGRAERAEQLDPIIGLFRYGHALINQGTEESFLEADLVADKIDVLMKQRYAPQPTEEKIIEGDGRGKTPQALVPLLEGGGGRGQPANEMEMETVAPEEMLTREERRAETVRKQENE